MPLKEFEQDSNDKVCNDKEAEAEKNLRKILRLPPHQLVKVPIPVRISVFQISSTILILKEIPNFWINFYKL